MLKQLIALLGLCPCWLLLVPFTVLALPTDPKQTIELLADTVEFDVKQQQGMYKGHIQFSQGSSHLEADEAITRFDKQHTLIYVVARSQHQSMVHFWTQPTEQDPLFNAYAQTIEYFPSQHLIVMTGNAKVTYDKNELSAHVIRFDTLTHHTITEKTPTHRTQMIFFTDSAHAPTLSSSSQKSF